MVAEMSKHNSDYIMREMPYARGLQFRTLYWQAKGLEIDFDLSTGASLDRIIE